MASKSTKTRIVLLDAHAILHRAYHALPDFTSPQGEPVGALFGISSMLMAIAEELKPDHLLACYDLPEKTFRHEAYAEYKAGRQKTDEALVAQMIRSRDIFTTFGVPIYEMPGYEADDLLGTLADALKKDKQNEIIIASGDMDTLQLVDKKRVQVYTLKKGIKDTIMYDETAVLERFGFPPKLLIDYKGLRGDPSDNIPGIQGIGEKTATELITAFGSIEKIYTALKKKDGEAVFKEAGIKPRVIGLLKDGEDEARFSKELATIQRTLAVDATLPEKSWLEALDHEAIVALFQELGFRTLTARFKQRFGGSGVAEVEAKPEVVDPGELQETALALWLLHSDTTNPTLDDILGYAGTRQFAEARQKIMADLATEGLEEVYRTIEKPLLPIVERMETHGVLIDVSFLKKLSKEYHAELAKLETAIFKQAGGEFNVNSPRQLGKVLFDDLGLKPKNAKKTSTGQRSTKESELEKLRDEHPIINDVFAYRELQKLLSTYIDNIPPMVDEHNRLHARFSQAGTTTGRMSSQHPNLQNLPTKTERGRKIRQAVIAPERSVLAAFDYSQVELRIAAFLSGDEKLIATFAEGGDIHTRVASEMFAVPPEEVDYEMRRRAKVINFGILYGMGVNALRVQLGVERKEAQEYLNAYFQNFSGLAQYLEETKVVARHQGFTKTFFGRKRHFEGITSSLPFVRAAAERMAINAPIQGTQADITKLAMSAVDRWLEAEGYRDEVQLILQVHDELVYEVPEKKLAEIAPHIIECMQSILSLEDTRGVPLKVDMKQGRNWGELG